MKTLNRLALLLLLAGGLLITAGCPDDDGPVEPPVERDYGPPYGDIVFVDDGSFIATVGADGGAVTYLAGFGVGNTITENIFKVLWNPKDNPNDGDGIFGVYLPTDRSLYTVAQDGEITHIFEDVISGSYTFSKGGTYIAFAETDGDSINIVKQGVTLNDRELYQTIGSPFSIKGPLSLDNTLSAHILAYLAHASDADSNKIEIWAADGNRQILPEYLKAAYVRFAHHTDISDDMVWYLDEPSGVGSSQSITRMRLDNSQFEVQATVNYSSIGAGARCFSLAADENKAAFFVDVLTTPKLVVVENDAAREVPLAYPAVLPTSENDLRQAAPDWSPDGTQLVYLGLDGNTHAVVIVDVESGDAQVVYSGMDTDLVCSPSWRK